MTLSLRSILPTRCNTFFFNQFFISISFVLCFNSDHLISTDLASKSLFPSCHVCFTPTHNCTEKIIKKINGAHDTIYMQAYSFTAMPIVDALLKAKARGINVQVILDKSHLSHPKIAQLLVQKGIKVWVDSPAGIAHNKLLILDRYLVITGSFNFSYAAQYKNRENVLFIANEALANQYIDNWYQCQKSAKVFKIPSVKKQEKPYALSTKESLLFLAMASFIGIARRVLR